MALGSFATVCAHRLPAGESIVRPRSRCPHCRSLIRWKENVPLLSYLLLRGRCAHCRKPIPWRYPATELACAALFAAVFLEHGRDWRLLILGGLLSFALLVMSMIDIEHRIIPNALSVGLFLAGIGTSWFNPILGPTFHSRVLFSIVGAGTGFLLMLSIALAGKWIWGKDALGGGDIKLMGALGAFLGWKGVFITLFLSSFAGTIFAISLMALRRISRRSYLPFGPFLALGAWCYWLGFDRLNVLWPF
ncbi:MAG: prepilin peptidase [Elusimicrobia bacterium]|nr:prepilin peptidase [Elusimicrobiota bacterium]